MTDGGDVAFERLVLGSAQWGGPYGIANRTGAPDPETLRRILTLAGSRGCRWIDTARTYGASEAVIGQAVGAASRWRVMTKLDPGVADGVERPDEAVERTDRSVRSSLDALRVRSLDTLLLHRASHRTRCGGAIWEHLRSLQADAVIGRLGVSAYGPDEAFDAVEDPSVGVIQVPFSLFDQRARRSGLFETAARRDVVVVCRSIFLQGAGLLDGSDLPPGLSALAPYLEDVDSWSRERSSSRLATLVRFARDAAPGPVVIGLERPEQAGETMDAWSGPRLTESELSELSDLVPPLPVHVVDPSRW